MPKRIHGCFFIFLVFVLLGMPAYADTMGTVTVTAPQDELQLDIYDISDVTGTTAGKRSNAEFISDYIKEHNIAPDFSVYSEGKRWIIRDLPDGCYYLSLECDDYEMSPVVFSMPSTDEEGNSLIFFEVYPKFDEPGEDEDSGGGSSNGGWSGSGGYDPDADTGNGPGVTNEESEPETSAVPVDKNGTGGSGNGEAQSDGLNNSQTGGGLIGQLQDMIHSTLSDTGDHSDPIFYLSLMAVSLAGIIVTVNFGRKRKKQ